MSGLGVLPQVKGVICEYDEYVLSLLHAVAVVCSSGVYGHIGATVSAHGWFQACLGGYHVSIQYSNRNLQNAACNTMKSMT